MAIHPLIPFLPDYTQFNTQWALSVCGVAGLYGLVGCALPLATPIAAAVFGVTSTLSSRVFLWIFDKLECTQDIVTQKVAAFAISLFAGSIVGTLLTNATGLSLSFAAGILLHTAVVGSVLTVIFVAIPCLLCIGATIGIYYLPNN